MFIAPLELCLLQRVFADSLPSSTKCHLHGIFSKKLESNRQKLLRKRHYSLFLSNEAFSIFSLRSMLHVVMDTLESLSAKQPIMLKKIFSQINFTLLILASVTPALQSTLADEGARVTPHNIIFFIGDGMGPEEIRASRLVRGAAHVFESFPYQGQVTTYSADNTVTDSAAAATAMATGNKVNNGVLSLALPGTGAEYQTLLEYFKSRGKAVGLVTTTSITSATPAAFGAHETSRSNYSAIAADYFQQTKPNILFGGGDSSNGITAAAAQAAGYTVVTNQAELEDIDTESATMISGQFGNGNMPYEYDGLGTLPHLSDMVRTALRVLDNDSNGFFLMVEGGLIDYAGHANSLVRSVEEVAEFNEAINEALSWLPEDSETLIVVTADHETGGLSIISDILTGGYPSVTWSTTGHTATNVKVFAHGYGAESFTNTIDNTDYFAKISTAGEQYNTAPIVSAGNDVSLPSKVKGSQSYQLTGTVTDDEINTSAGVSYSWSQTSGPTATIDSPYALTTNVTLPVAGTYVFSLNASDGFALASDTVTVNVIAPPTVSVSSKKDIRAKKRIVSIKLLKRNTAQPSFDTSGCQVNFYLLPSKQTLPSSSTKIATIAAPKSKETIYLSFVPTSISEATTNKIAVYMEAQLICNDGHKIRSAKVEGSLISKGSYKKAFSYWKKNYSVSIAQ